MKNILKITISSLLLFLIIIAIVGAGVVVLNEQQETKDQLEQALIELSMLKEQANIDSQYVAIVKALIEGSDRPDGGNTLTPDQITEVARVIFTLSETHRDIGLTPSLILAIMTRETHFNPRALSDDARAYGIMQTLRSTAEPHLEDLGLSWSSEILYNPVVSTKVGVMELVRLHKMYMEEGLEDNNTWHLSIHSYFWGPGNTRILYASKGERVEVPSLEYSVGVRKIQNSLKESFGLF